MRSSGTIVTSLLNRHAGTKLSCFSAAWFSCLECSFCSLGWNRLLSRTCSDTPPPPTAKRLSQSSPTKQPNNCKWASIKSMLWSIPLWLNRDKVPVSISVTARMKLMSLKPALLERRAILGSGKLTVVTRSVSQSPSQSLWSISLLDLCASSWSRRSVTTQKLARLLQSCSRSSLPLSLTPLCYCCWLMLTWVKSRSSLGSLDLKVPSLTWLSSGISLLVPLWSSLCSWTLSTFTSISVFHSEQRSFSVALTKASVLTSAVNQRKPLSARLSKHTWTYTPDLNTLCPTDTQPS